MSYLKYMERIELQHALQQIGITTPVPGKAEWPQFESNYINFKGPTQFAERATDQFEAWLESRGYFYVRYNPTGIQNIEPRAVLLMCDAFGYCPYQHDAALLADVLAEIP